MTVEELWAALDIPRIHPSCTNPDCVCIEAQRQLYELAERALRLAYDDAACIADEPNPDWFGRGTVERICARAKEVLELG